MAFSEKNTSNLATALRLRQVLVFVLVLFFTSGLFAQQLPSRPNVTDENGNKQGDWVFYFDRQWKKTTDSLRVSFFRLVRYQDNLPAAITRDYYRTGQKQWEGKLLADEPQDIYDGKQTWYYQSGETKSYGEFDQGKLVAEPKYLLRDGNPADADWQNKFFDPAFEATEINDYKLAIELFSKALPHAEAIHDLESEESADIILWLGICWFNLGNQEMLLRYELQLANIYNVIREPSDPDRLQSIYDVARSYKKLGRWNQSETWYKEFLYQQSRHSQKTHTSYGVALAGLGEVLIESRKYDEALSILEKGKEFYDRNPPEEKMELDYLISVYTRARFLTGRWTEGKEMLLAELKRLEKETGKNSLAYAESLSALGNFYRMKGQLREAETCFLSSHETMLKYENIYSHLGTLLPLVEVYLQTGEGYQAQNYIEVARNRLALLNKETEEYPFVYFSFLRRMVDVHDFLGDFPKKQQSLEEMLTLGRQRFGTNSLEYLQSLSLYAEHYIKQNQLDQAFRLLNDAKEILNHFSIEGLHAPTLRSLAKLYQQIGYVDFFRSISFEKQDHAAARFSLQKSLSFYNSLPEQGFIPEKLDVLLTLAMIEGVEGNDDKADNLYRDCLSTVEINFTRNHPYYTNLLFAIAKKAEISRDIKKGQQYYRKAVKGLNDYIDHILPHLSTEEKESFYQSNTEWIENYRSFGVTHSITEPSLITDLYDLQLTNKAVVLKSITRIQDVLSNHSDEKVNQLFNDWRQRKNELLKIMQHGTPAEINAHEKEINSVEKKLSVVSSEFEKWSKPGTDWKKVQENLREGQAAIEIMHVRRELTGDTIYAALVLRKDVALPKLILIGKANDLEGKGLRYYRNAIKAQVKDTLSYTKFWKPIAKELGNIKEIYISPDGVFHQVSIATLFDPATGQYVLDKMNILYLASTGQLVNLKSGDTKLHKVTIFAHPDFGTQSNENGTELKSRSLNFENIADLPGTHAERIAISNLLAAHNITSVEYSESKATEAAIKNVNNPEVLHIATHGFFLAGTKKVDHTSNGSVFLGIGNDQLKQNPLLLSGLLLAGCQNQAWKKNAINSTYSEDGVLTAFEASTLNLSRTELVVLSACETGLGEVKNGEGVYGLQRAFTMAGARQLIMSLWKVDDEATNLFMVEFYSKWIKGGKTSDAFRHAQRSIQQKYPDPYYWGAFIMQVNH